MASHARSIHPLVLTSAGPDGALQTALVRNYARPPQGPPGPGGGPPVDARADCEARAEDTNHLKER